MKYWLASEDERARRRGMMNEAHVSSLHALVCRLRLLRPVSHVPTFDPLDGGVLADVLLLMEAPGPKTKETGFVSRDNPDMSADNMRGFLEDAGIDRRRTLIWNAVPWYLASEETAKFRAPDAVDILEAQPWLDEVIGCMTRLQTVVLVGRKAQKAWKCSPRNLGVATAYMPHPSLSNLNRRPQDRDAIRATLGNLIV